MPSAFVPVYNADPVIRRLQDRVQRATTAPAQSSGLRTESFDAAVGGVYRVRSTSTATLEVRLPQATAATYGQSVTIILDNPVSSVRFTCPTGQVNGGASVSVGSSVAQVFLSNGDNGWFRV